MKKHKKSEHSVVRRKAERKNTVEPAPAFSQALFRAVMDGHAKDTTHTDDDFDRMMKYVLREEAPDHPAYREVPLTDDEVRSIQKKIVESPDWARLYRDLLGEYRQILDALEHSSLSHVRQSPAPVHSFLKKRFILFPLFSLPQYRIPRIALISTAALMVVFGVLAGMSSLITPHYFDATVIEPDTYTTRGEPGLLGSGINAYHRKDYSTALDVFRRTTQENPGSDDALIASYLSGSVHLTCAQRSFFGFFPSFDPLLVDSGITVLSAVVKKIENTGTAGLLDERCHFLLGKAWLMKKEIPMARREFERVIQFQGPRKYESSRILSLLPPQ